VTLPDGLKLVVQARLESTRLPRKVVQPLLGQPLLLQLLDRLTTVFDREDILVAVARTEANAELVGLLHRHGYEARMPEVAPEDVLARYADLAAAEQLDAVVRVTGDCPLLDAQVILELIKAYRSDADDLALMAQSPAWADGLDAEVIAADALLSANAEATRPSDREHVTPYLWRDAARFAQALLPCPLDLSGHCWSVDDAADLRWAERVYLGLYRRAGRGFGWREVYAYLATHPDLWQHATGRVRNQAYVAQLTAEGVSAASWEALRYQGGATA
jgi:spore coat polysaccharide biosynthesis protein SpsF (cytidylyltransferase family)